MSYRYQWYRLFNYDEFANSGFTSIEGDFFFEGIGQKTVLITKGNLVSVLIDDLLLPVNLNGKNPFGYLDRAVVLDQYGDVWWGVLYEN